MAQLDKFSGHVSGTIDYGVINRYIGPLVIVLLSREKTIMSTRPTRMS
jgi:hypothetical protein